MKYIYTSIFLFIVVAVNGQKKSTEKIVQANLDAYNNRDIETFMFYISDSIKVYNFGEPEPVIDGKSEVKEVYKSYFNSSPNLHSKIIKRIIFDNKVIDYEHITGARGNDKAFEIILIYEVHKNKIVKMTSIRK